MSEPSLRIEWGVSNVPHPDKGDGEDTWFTINDAKYPAAAVFDGVGSWAEQNINPYLLEYGISRWMLYCYYGWYDRTYYYSKGRV